MEIRMKYDPDGHRRRSIRLSDYDYSQEGAYFVTICARGRECLFGEIANGVMNLNHVGVIVRDEWLRSEQIRREILLDAFVVTPNHLHGIVLIVHDVPPPVGATGGRPHITAGPSVLLKKTVLDASCKQVGDRRSPLRARGPGKQSLSSFVGGFKSSCARSINECLGTAGISVWRRNYYEHVIRSDRALYAIRDYIEANPLQWASDPENPECADNRSKR
jgi:REP element-mobilizing transposase RayT